MGLFSRKPTVSATQEAVARTDIESLRFAVQIIIEAQSRMTIVDVEGREIRQPCCERLSIMEAALERFNAELGV